MHAHYSFVKNTHIILKRHIHAYTHMQMHTQTSQEEPAQERVSHARTHHQIALHDQSVGQDLAVRAVV